MEKLANDYKVRIDNGEELSFHWKCILPSEIKIDVEVVVKRMQVGEMSFVLGRLRNITNELDSICRLIESETQFREIVENTNTIIIKYDINGIIQFYNEFAFKLLGYTANEAIGKNVFALLSPYIQPEDLMRKVDTKAWIDYIIKNQYINPYIENWVITKTGKRLYIGWTSKAIVDIDDKIIGIQSIGIDRTENKIMQTKLIESEKKFRLIFNSVTEGITIVDFEGEILEINDSALEFIGHNRSDIGSMVSLKEVTYSIIPQFDQLAAEVRKNGQILVEIPIYYRDGRVIPSEFQARKIRYNNKDVILSVSRDISERKMHQQEVLRAAMDAEENERSRVAKDLHDSVSPILSASKLYAQSIKNITDEHLQDQVIDKLVSTITESMKTISEISNKLSPHVLENFGLIEAINTFINKISGTTKIVFEIQSNLTERIGTNIEFTLYRVVTELINNSIKHSEATNISISLSKTDKIVLTYIDNGKGFDLKTIAEHKRGMGLFNVNTRVGSINGSTKIITEPEKGFKYVAIIPVLP
jgi:PAS domain S-box-containing protein